MDLLVDGKGIDMQKDSLPEESKKPLSEEFYLNMHQDPNGYSTY